MDIKAAAAALTAVCVLLTGGCSVRKSGNKIKNADRPDSWSVEQRSVEDITPLKNEENVYITHDEENKDSIKLIQGVLSSEPVRDENDALDLIASYSKEMGYNDVYSEMKFAGSTDYGDRLDYRFDQYFEGKEIIEGYIVLTVDKRDGCKPIILDSRYSDMWEFDSKPKVSSAVAVKCAADKYKVAKNTVPELAIYYGPVLVWIVPVADEKVGTVYIDANNGNIIHRELSV